MKNTKPCCNTECEHYKEGEKCIRDPTISNCITFFLCRLPKCLDYKPEGETMNKDLRQNIKNMEKEIAEMKLKLEAKDYIEIPDNIKFECGCGDSDFIGIVFNNEKQELHTRGDIYIVDSVCPGGFIKCKIINDEKLIAGGTYYVTDKRVENIMKERVIRQYYCKFLDNKFWFVDDYNQVRSINVDLYFHHYRIVPMED